MRRWYTFILLLLLFTIRGIAQSPETIILGNVVKEGNADDESYGPLNIGFSFTFFGNTYNQFYVSSNGLVSFGAGSTESEEVSIPASSSPNNFIAALWDDLIISNSGKILYTTIGVAPNRRLIIQCTNMGFYPTPIFMGTYLIILNETSNKIQVQYRIVVDATSARAHGESATIGIENSGGTTGKLYKYHDPSAIATGKAISFTPSGSNYTLNSDTTYDRVLLTTNLTLPEPGIPLLKSPPQNAVIGSDYTFEWEESSDAESYTLLISTFSDLGDAVSYPAGSNLSYTVTGLTVPETYYWGVFATNATGTTWCEIKKFTTSSAPPLEPVPQTVWLEKDKDKTIKLNYTGGGVDPKIAKITSLPLQGQLFRYNAGTRGTLIMPGDLPATITDAGMNVIYAATGSAGNGVGNFNFMIQEGANVSPAGTVTVNVSPPGVPSVLYLAKNTSSVEIQFDRIMANPMSKKDQFTVKSNGTTAIIDSATLKPGDSSTILLYLSAPLTSPVLISYSPGDIVSASGGFLLPFSDQQVLLNSQTIHFTQSLSKKYSDSPFTLNASVTSGLGLTYSSSNLSVTTIAVNIATFHTTGTSDITARQAGNATYAPAKFTKSITIAKGDQAITFGAMSIKTFGDADFIPGASASSGLPVAYSSGNTAVATIENGQIHIIGAGTAIITASQSGSALWNPATEKTQTLTVLKATATVSLGSLSATYNGLPHTVSVTSIPSDLPVTITYDASGTAPANAGSYSVNAVVNHLNYQGTASGTLTIDKAPLTATADDKSKVYGQNNPALTISYSGLMNSESSAVIDVKPVAATAADVTTAAGDIAITVSGGTDNNYSFIYASGNLTINKATLIVTADDKTRIYGDANPPLTISYSGFVNSDNASVLDALPTVSTTAIASTNAGSVAITVLGGNDNNYLFTLVSGTLTITKATASVTLGNLTTLYTGFPQEASITTSPAGLVSDFTYNSSPSLPINSGSYALTVTINDVNYQGTASDIFIINKAVLIATADNKTRIYGENNPPLTISYSGFVNNENVSVLDFPLPVAATSADVSTDVGEVDITVSGGSDNNYLFSYISGTLTISKAMLTAFADDKTRKYGDANPSLSVSFSGFANSDNEPSIDITPVAATSAIASTNAGTVPITVSGGSDNNYTFTYVSGTLTITKAAASIIPGNLTATYTGLPHAISTITTPPGLYVDCTYNGTPAMPVNTGSYSFIATINDINYQGTATGTITINKAPLTFTADNKSKGYMTPVPSLTYTISGFVNSEIIQVLDLLPSIQTTAALNSPMGTYPITISGGSDNNYTYLYVPGTLEITKTPQTIVFDHSPEKLLIGENYTLEAISTSGLPVLFESLDNNIASVSGTIITGISKGTVQIRAFNAGDQNYNAAEIFATVEVYSTHKDIMHLFTPNSDGINDLWELPELSAWGKCDVRVYNRWGKLIYANRNYNNQWDATSNGNPVPEGAYYFIIKTERAGVVKGTVNIVR